MNSVLLLDLHPASEPGRALRAALAANTYAPIRVHYEPFTKPEGYDAESLSELLSRISPALIFLAAPHALLPRIQALLPAIHRTPAAPPVVLASDADAPEEIISLLQLGAADFIAAPFTPLTLLPCLWRLLELTRTTPVHGPHAGLNLPPQLLGESPTFLEVIRQVPLIAPCGATVLITGETGTGKEVCARAIHAASERAARPFVAINCGAIPLELVENELFGHERGAYTHAAATQAGQIEAAEGGTLFLDEIDSLPLQAQVKLLRFLQEKEFKPLGATRVRRADVRVIAATNVNIERAVREGRLRQDLYYRLNVLSLTLPPLRERRADIPLLAHSFVAKYAAEFSKTARSLAPGALQKLLLHNWPGNVRELEHVIARAVALAQHPIIHAHEITLPHPGDVPGAESFRQMKARLVEQFERTYIQGLLIACEGNITKAAQAAQKPRRAFFHLLRKYGINAGQFRAGRARNQQAVVAD